MLFRTVVLLGLLLTGPALVQAADPVGVVPGVTAPPSEGSVPATPASVSPAPVDTVKPVPVEKPRPIEKPKPVEKPKPAEKPKPVETPKPVEKPRPVVETTSAPESPSGKSAEAAAATADQAGENAAAGTGAVQGGYSFGCLALSFAMLIIGVAAGFLWRHLMIRHKLGGMSVRIGTWRGIP